MVLQGVGHIAFEEMPEICNQAMREWLSNPVLSELKLPIKAA
jgi:4,5:9,10-diseco-3-hydroxy-5,9,17-trioxoandrosta-1(10),2-diene-4-oate hydrolase